jgi:hypothetical protein
MRDSPRQRVGTNDDGDYQRYRLFKSVPDALYPLATALHVHGTFGAAPEMGALIRYGRCNASIHRRRVDKKRLLMRSDLAQVLMKSLQLPRDQHADHASPHPSQNGGATLGLGRSGTRVYTVDDFAMRYPTARTLCVNSHVPDTPPTCENAMVGGATPVTMSTHLLPPDCAIKDVRNEWDAMFESTLHQRIHGWFHAAGALAHTPLHPTINSADVTFLAGRDTTVTHRLIIMRAMAGDCDDMRLPPRHVAQFAEGVLQALVVLHAQGALHLDIKPANVLRRRKTAPNASTPDAPQFVLGDYDLLLPARVLLSDLAARRSTSVGTTGFMSPLLTSDDDTNDTYHAFQLVAAAVPRALALEERTAETPSAHNAIAKRTHFWEDYFRVQRERIRNAPTEEAGARLLQKVDLHSLALSMLDMLRAGAPPDTRSVWEQPRTLRAYAPSLSRFISRLMFFKKSDLHSAAQALDALHAIEIP